VERKSRFLMLVKVGSKNAPEVAEALGQHVRELPVELRRSLTWDRGTEMARHKDFTLATDMQVYFCDPHSPWQRGTNENTNGLLRQYLPKGKDLSDYSQDRLNEIAMRLNQRPRQTLGFSTPPWQTSRNAGRGRHARLRVSLSLAGLKAGVSRGEIG
jgi:IS30 family transposase